MILASMSKLKKGYFVKGKFVAEGSELDLEFKRELKGTDEKSRTDLKRESTELQKLGADLLTLHVNLLPRLELPEKLLEAMAEYKRITNFEGRRRLLQFIGKRMRQLSPETLDAIRTVLEEQHTPSAEATMTLHAAEQWRDRLIADEDAMGQWRHGRAYRDIFLLVREQLQNGSDIPDATADSSDLPHNPGADA